MGVSSPAPSMASRCESSSAFRLEIFSRPGRWAIPSSCCARTRPNPTRTNSPCAARSRSQLVLGWDDPSTPLRAHIRTPSGKLINERKIRPVRGRTWVFWKIPLPHQGERDGTWTFTVERVPTGGEFSPPPSDVRYFFLVICSGGPKLVHLGGPRRVYTGDPLDSLVGLHFGNGTSPHAEVKLIIKAPTISLGQLVTDAGLQPPSTSVDAVGGFYATLQSIARLSGGTLPVSTSTITVPLFDDGSHDDGAMEPDGIYNNRLKDLTRVEGTYRVQGRGDVRRGMHRHARGILVGSRGAGD